MPNPSTIAMEETAPDPATITPSPTRFMLLIDNGNLKERIEVLQKLLAAEEARTNELAQRLSNMQSAHNRQLAPLTETIGTLKARNQELLGTTAQMGWEFLTMEQSRDRVLAENCAMTQRLRDLKKIARAAAEYSAAETAFVEMVSPSDEVTERVANAEGELEQLLETHRELYQG